MLSNRQNPEHLTLGTKLLCMQYTHGGVCVFCFRLVRCVLLSLQSPRLSQQSLRVDWRTCGQTWPPSLFCSHGTESRPDKYPGNMFFQLKCSGSNFWLNPLTGFPPVFFFFFYTGWVCFMEFARLHEMPGALWYLLKSSQAGRLTDLWFLFSVLCSIFLLCVNQTRLCHAFVGVNATPRQHTEVRKIGNMCPS